IWGNRNWAPYLTDEVRTQAQEGRTRFLSIDTSAYSSYSSCRQYREDFAKTIETLAGEGLEVSIDKIRQFYNHPGYADACAACLDDGLADFRRQVGEFDADRHRILFVTHSIPTVMQDASAVATNGYLAPEATAPADDLGFAFTRVATVGTHETVVSGLVDLVEERIGQLRGEEVETPALSGTTPLVPGSGACSIDCCRGRIDRAVYPN